MNAFLFDFPLNCNIIGGTNSGKSTWIQKVLDTPEVWAHQPQKIYYFYGIESEALKQIQKKHPDAFFHKGMPSSFEGLFNPQLNNVCIFDDLAQELESSPEFTNFLVVSCMCSHKLIYNFKAHLFLERNTPLECCLIHTESFPFC